MWNFNISQYDMVHLRLLKHVINSKCSPKRSNLTLTSNFAIVVGNWYAFVGLKVNSKIQSVARSIKMRILLTSMKTILVIFSPRMKAKLNKH